MKNITAYLKRRWYFGAAMNDMQQFPAKETPKASRRAYLLESLAIVLLAALAAYGAS